MNNKKVYGKKLDKTLAKLITDLKWVPYQLNKHSKPEVGHTYWCGEMHRVYTVVSESNVGLEVRWENGHVRVEHSLHLDFKHDYELKPFEIRFAVTTPLFNEIYSYTAAEIKALVFAGVIKDEDVVECLFKNYFNANCKSKDHVYYYLNIKRKYDTLDVKLVRDMKKSPYNFGYIKTVEDVFNDTRIAANKWRFIDNEEKEVEVIHDTLDKVIPHWTPILSIEYTGKKGYDIKLDMYQREGHTYGRWTKMEELFKNDKIYASLTAPYNTRYLVIDENGCECLEF